jgi:hypothetical protein
MNTSKRILSLIVSVGSAAVLFFYLAETVILWRIVLSSLVLIAAFFMIDGFLRRG